MLNKTRPCVVGIIACKLAGVKKVYGFGIGSQKYFVEKFSTLNKNDLRYNYTEQSIKFLDKHNISHDFKKNFLLLMRVCR